MKKIIGLVVLSLFAISASAADLMASSTAPTVTQNIVVEGAACPGVGATGFSSTGLLLSCQSGVWSGTGSKVVFSSTTASGGPYSFSLDASGIIFVDAHSFRDGSDVYTSIFINGVLCNRDRGYDSPSWHSYASASCTRHVPAGDYVVQVTERVRQSSVTVLSL